MPPTCPRRWGAFGSWLADTRVVAPSPDAPYALQVTRTLASGTTLLSGGATGFGGFYVADAGGVSISMYGDTGFVSIYGSDAMRGPWRVTPQGTLTFITSAPLQARSCDAVWLRCSAYVAA